MYLYVKLRMYDFFVLVLFVIILIWYLLIQRSEKSKVIWLIINALSSADSDSWKSFRL